MRSSELLLQKRERQEHEWQLVQQLERLLVLYRGELACGCEGLQTGMGVKAVTEEAIGQAVSRGHGVKGSWVAHIFVDTADSMVKICRGTDTDADHSPPAQAAARAGERAPA